MLEIRCKLVLFELDFEILYKQPKYTSHVIEVSLSEIHLVMKTGCIYVMCVLP